MILLLESLHPDAEALLAEARDAGELLRAPSPSHPGDLPWDRLRAILTRSRGRVSADVIARCPALEAVGRAGIGLDNVDLEAAGRRGIRVVYAPGGNAATVAEHTLALMLALVRGVGPMAQAVARGRWQERDGYRGDELAGKTVGVVGLGAIGRRVAHLAAAFGMRVLVAAHTSPGRSLAPGKSPPDDWQMLPLPALLAESDVVTLHVPLTPATRGLVDGDALARMKAGAFLINTARGALVDQRALAAALDSGRLAGFAADVLDAEPPPADEPLLASPRALITPHVAALTATSYRNVCLRTARNVLAILRGEPPDPGSVYRGTRTQAAAPQGPDVSA